MSTPLLEVTGLAVRFDTRDGPVHAVRGLDLSLAAGETLGVVGESGSGKSQAVLALLGLLAANGRAGGRALFEGQDLLALDEAALNRVRGSRIGMVFQDPMTSLNPCLSIGTQMGLVLAAHRGLGRRAASREAAAMLDAVGIPDPARRLQKRPVSNDEIKSPVRPADYVPPVRQYREVSPGHAVMIWGEEWEKKDPAAIAA